MRAMNWVVSFMTMMLVILTHIVCKKTWTNNIMKHDKIYNWCYASDLDDDGPKEDIDQEGCTAK
jgi:hypothetical protein